MHHGEMMVALIVGMVLFARAYRDRCAARGEDAWGRFGVGRRRDRPSGVSVRFDGAQDDAENQRLREEVRSLKDRIAVLERIATDRSTSLDREIEALRDRP